MVQGANHEGSMLCVRREAVIGHGFESANKVTKQDAGHRIDYNAHMRMVVIHLLRLHSSMRPRRANLDNTCGACAASVCSVNKPAYPLE